MLPRSIREIHDAFDRKTLSPVELARDFLSAARASDHNAYLLICEERALLQARQAEQVLEKEGRVPRDKMPLLGIPLAIKDSLVIEGVRTTCASRMLENYVPPYTATAVKRLEEAGGVTLGKANMDEFAMGGSNENSAFGPVKHPTQLDRVPGGSSGGSATAVRAGLCVAALGSDTGGSIRLPAHFCGIVGLKPTYGRVSRFGLIAFASSLDQVGPMASSVEDAALLLDAMAGHDPLDSTSLPGTSRSIAHTAMRHNTTTSFARAAATPADWKNLRVGMPAEYFGPGLAPEVANAIEGALKWMESRGAKLVPISLPHTEHSVAVYYLVAVSEASSNLARYDGIRYGFRPAEADVQDLASFYRQARSRFGAEVKRRILLGTFALSSGYSEAYYQRACQVRRLIRQDFDRAFEQVDLIAGPVSPTTAFRLGEKIQDPLQMYLNDIFTIPASLAGLPAISVPCEARELPIGLHLIGPALGEERLLSFAADFERGRAGSAS